MPKKPDLSKAFGERFKTEEKVDVQDPIAAAVQASQQVSTDESTEVSQLAREQESFSEGKNARMHAYTPDVIPESVNVSKQDGKQVRKSASRPAPKQERTDAVEEAYIGKGVIIEVLYDQIQQKKHLSNGSFRYKADELEKLDAIYKNLEQRKPGRISKNDIARMALIAFYEDFEKNGDESILAQVFKRM